MGQFDYQIGKILRYVTFAMRRLFLTWCDLLRDALQFTTGHLLRDVVRVAVDDAVTVTCRYSDVAVIVRYMAMVRFEPLET